MTKLWNIVDMGWKSIVKKILLYISDFASQWQLNPSICSFKKNLLLPLIPFFFFDPLSISKANTGFNSKYFHILTTSHDQDCYPPNPGHYPLLRNWSLCLYLALPQSALTFLAKWSCVRCSSDDVISWFKPSNASHLTHSKSQNSYKALHDPDSHYLSVFLCCSHDHWLTSVQLLPCSGKVPGTLLPHGLCTSCSLSLECSLSRSPVDFIQMSPSQCALPWLNYLKLQTTIPDPLSSISPLTFFITLTNS